MEWLNYHHLLYFSLIAQEGSLTRAAARLHVTHSTLSVQLRALEEFLGGPLFERRGRALVPTPLGVSVAAYADEIFRTGAELVDMARGRTAPRAAPLRIGVVGSIPKSVVYKLLEPAFAAGAVGPISLRQDDLHRLLEDLAGGRLHLIFADGPPPDRGSAPAEGHPLGESRVLVYGTPALAERYGGDFPASLAGAPFLLPGPESGLRAPLERWLAKHELRVDVEGELGDAEALRAFGEKGHGIFPVPGALAAEIDATGRVRCLGRAEGVQARFFAITVEQRARHPAVAALVDDARRDAPRARLAGH